MKRKQSGLNRTFAVKPLAACVATFVLAATAGASDPVHALDAVQTPLRRARSSLFSLAAIPHAASTDGLGRAARLMRPVVGKAPSSVASVPVTNCADDGSGGTLREAVATAVDGSTIDMSALACSSITLAMGEIDIVVNNLTLLGRADGSLIIDASHASPVIAHTGSGTLTINHLVFRNGRRSVGTDTEQLGGCIYSTADVVLDHSTLSSCWVGTQFIPGFGAGVLALGGITLTDSTVTLGFASGDGGGVMSVNGDVQITRSTLSYNGCAGKGGGVFSQYGNLVITSSTVSGNGAATKGGGLYAFYGSTSVSNSTISGNSAVVQGGGIQAFYALSLRNSTVALNSAGGGGGVYLAHDAPDIVSSIVSNNTVNGSAHAADIGAFAALTITGSHNVIATSDATTPGDTLTNEPQLQGLADWGGPTKTHGMFSMSVAVDAGLNPDALTDDQRGSGFVRAFGAATDIGAFEIQAPANDLLFKNGFD
ncbi:MAG: choice-of-anchor Q domain-containing protein [Dokdonella sp.]